MRNLLDFVAAIRTLAASANVAILAVERWVVSFKPEMSRFCFVGTHGLVGTHRDRWHGLRDCTVGSGDRWGQSGSRFRSSGPPCSASQRDRLTMHPGRAPRD